MIRIRIAGALLLLAACGDGVPLVQPNAPNALTLSPEDLPLAVRAEVRFAVTAYDAEGRPVDTPPLLWTSSDPAVATVNEAGFVTGVALGSATITAASGALRATGTVRVQPGGLKLFVLGSRPVAPGSTVELHAVPVDAKGTPILGNPSVAWTSSDSGVATVLTPVPDYSRIAIVTGVAGGTTQIRAASSGFFAVVDITVMAPLSGGASSLSVLDFRVIEVEYPTHPGRKYYAPQLRVANTGSESAIDVLRIDPVVPGLPPPIPSSCTSIRLAPGENRELFTELYGDYPITWDAPGYQANGMSPTATLHYKDGTGITRMLGITGSVIPGGFPTTLTGGIGLWSSCPPGT
jgi:hypothetical protein